MPSAIKYRIATGEVFGSLDASSEELLNVQIGNLMPGIGAIILPVDHLAITKPQEWMVLESILVKKVSLSIMASKDSIEADGVDESIVSVIPTQAISLLVNGVRIQLASGETLAITSDVPKRFDIEIGSIDRYAEKKTVKAI